ncbi:MULTISPECIES: hypothetical protein [Halomicrobium]|uniref:Uncharacterized protein n=1 Tax=Halomicrobium mukohataei TaxID=57705 RepID=A0A4D6KFS5_9EURY|nr:MULTISPECIES: hypothetical protein [Halomicrobium]QCD65709.1 hypothetical protein E5139_08725 [Halomicrobium mukohataei]QFR20515.1 hypothetical protein GBQ70_08720 [Halomicrobium sp. ZPS1]
MGRMGKISFGLSTVLLGTIITLDGLVESDLRFHFVLNRMTLAGILMIASGMLYAIGGKSGKIPSFDSDGARILSKAWIWYIGTILMTIAAVLWALKIFS